MIWKGRNSDEATFILEVQLKERFAIAHPDLLAATVLSGWGLFAPILANWLNVNNAVISGHPPVVVLVNNDLEMIRRSACSVAKLRSVPAVNLQHGMINRGQQYRLGVADRHLLWGRFFERVLTELGVDEKRLSVVGAPQYESVRGFDLPGYPPRLLYAAQPASWELPIDTCRRLIRLHFGLATDNPKLQVRVRLHPREGPDIRKMAFDLSARQRNFDVDESDSIWDALENCHVVSTVFSTVGLDAAVLRRPTMVLDFVREARNMPIERMPPIFSVTSEEGLANTVRKVLDWQQGPSASEDWGLFTAEYLGGLKTDAASRAAAEILKTMSN